MGKEGPAGSHGSWLGSVASDSLLSPHFGGGGVCQEQQAPFVSDLDTLLASESRKLKERV